MNDFTIQFRCGGCGHVGDIALPEDIAVDAPVSCASCDRQFVDQSLKILERADDAAINAAFNSSKNSIVVTLAVKPVAE